MKKLFIIIFTMFFFTGCFDSNEETNENGSGEIIKNQEETKIINEDIIPEHEKISEEEKEFNNDLNNLLNDLLDDESENNSIENEGTNK